MNCIQQKPTNLPIPLICYESFVRCKSPVISSEDITPVDLNKKSTEGLIF